MTEPEANGPEIRTRVGIARLGCHVVVHGKDLHRECLDLGFVHYLLFCVTGRVFDSARAGVLERLWVATGYPDARIWCNRVAAYLGSARVDPGLALSAALAASNSTAYGFRAMSAAYAVQADIPDELAAREAWLDHMFAERRHLAGYGRPARGSDERIAVALDSLARAGLSAGPALKRAFSIDRMLGARKGIYANIAAVWAALAIDFGIDRREYEAFMLLMFAPGYMAVYAEWRGRPPLDFLFGHQTSHGPRPSAASSASNI
jgi:citrate synthase